MTSYLAIAAGELATVTDVVPALTGHPARTVAEHLRAHPEDWAHLPLIPARFSRGHATTPSAAGRSPCVTELRANAEQVAPGGSAARAGCVGAAAPC